MGIRITHSVVLYFRVYKVNMDENDDVHISCEASLIHGCLSGMFYGAMWGAASAHSFIKEYDPGTKALNLPKPSRIESLKILGRLVFCMNIILDFNVIYRSVATGTIGFTYFMAAFRSAECVISRIITDRSAKPFVQGSSAFCAAILPLYWDSRCIRTSW